MIELVQVPWSPFCIVQRRILEFAGVEFKTTNIPPQERSLVWKLSRQRYYGVPLLRDGRNVVFEVSEDSQVIAKYLDSKLGLGLFPAGLEGVQFVLWRCIENEIEGATFRLNDIYYREFVPRAEQLQYLRFKERKFGAHCLDLWRAEQKSWLKKLVGRLWRNRTVPLKLSFGCETEREFESPGGSAILTCPLCGVVPINWTVHNKWCRFVIETKNSEKVLVGTGGGAERVPLDRATPPLRGRVAPILPAADIKSREKSPDKTTFLAYSNVSSERLPGQRKGRPVPTRQQAGTDERGMKRAVKHTPPAQAVPEIYCAKCHATRSQLAAHGDSGPCCNPFLTCSYELLWRSLPGGEDR